VQLFFAQSRMASLLQRRCFCFFVPIIRLRRIIGTIPAFAGTEPKEAPFAITGDYTISCFKAYLISLYGAKQHKTFSMAVQDYRMREM
jgi:hypothetical protein